MAKLLITGSSGLIGSALMSSLPAANYEVIGIDTRPPLHPRALQLDITDAGAIADLLAEVDGVIHLAAVSRVIFGERNPAQCRAINIGGTFSILTAIQKSRHKPWIIYASSREVYGEPENLPVSEDAPLRPVNVYGETKVVAERCVEAHAAAGFTAAIVRFSNVYGNATTDHPDRVVPAFCAAAIAGDALRVDGGQNTFDFTHISDVARGLVSVIETLNRGMRSVPPIHFVSGIGTTLGELAVLVSASAGVTPKVIEAPSRSFDVSRFRGDFSRAKELLGWTPQVALSTGIAMLVQDMRSASGAGLLAMSPC